MDTEKWLYDMIGPMAEDFAKCEDKAQIKRALEKYHQLFVAEMSRRLTAAALSSDLNTILSNLRSHE